MKGLNYCDGKTVRKSLNFVECVAKTKLNFTAMVTFSPNLKKVYTIISSQKKCLLITNLVSEIRYNWFLSRCYLISLDFLS